MDRHKGAQRILRSWLDACGVQYNVREGQVVINNAPITLNHSDESGLLSTNFKTSLSIFHKITEGFGLGKPDPVNRGKAPEKKVYDDPILARFRHKEFRTAPNNAQFLKTYDALIRRECGIFLSKNRRLCKELGYEIEDLVSYAQVWSTTFAHRSQILDADGDDNYALLTVYLRQRFTELFKSFLLERRASSVNADPGITDPLTFDDAEPPNPEWKTTHNQLIGGRSERKRKATVLLNDSLDGLGHDDKVAVLEHACTHPCPDTARIAKRYLQAHKDLCETCRGLEVKQ